MQDYLGDQGECCTDLYDINDTPQCGANEGECEADHECMGDLICGWVNNCNWTNGNPYWEECCVAPLSYNDGPCTTDADCEGDLVCGNGNCPGDNTTDCCRPLCDMVRGKFRDLTVLTSFT